MSKRVVIVGQGYVGLPIAMRAVEVGHEVVGLEKDPTRAERLAAGDSFVEDVSAATLQRALATRSYSVSTSIDAVAGFDVAVITVPTPLRDTLPDLTFIEDAAAELAPFVRAGCLVVLESTTYPGTTEELMIPILEAGSGLEAGKDFGVGYSPERIDPGNAVWGFVNTPKVVSGIDEGSLGQVVDFYGSLVDKVIPVSGCKEAELTKLLENTFRHVNIALVNELAMFANDLGIDVWESIDAASTKPFGYMRFTPGPGVGGHCLPIDPSYLSWRVRQSLGRQFRFVELANDINDHMPHYVVDRLFRGLNKAGKALSASRIVLLGISYKKNSGDARESPAIAVGEQLLDLGANVRVIDPHVEQIPTALARAQLVRFERSEIESADAVVVLTDHDVFDYPLVAECARWVLDTRNRLPVSDRWEVL